MEIYSTYFETVLPTSVPPNKSLHSRILFAWKDFTVSIIIFSLLLEGCFCCALHIKGYTDWLLGAPTVSLNRMTCSYISSESATLFFSTQFFNTLATVHLVPVNCLLSILNNTISDMKPAEYELKLMFVIIHGANYLK